MMNRNNEARKTTKTMTLALAAAAAMTADVARAQFTIAVGDGSFITGAGAVTTVDNLAINNSGQWFVESDTDGPTTSDVVLIQPGLTPFLQEGQVLPGVGTLGTVTLSSLDAVNINNAGLFGGNIFLDGATTTTDSGVYQNANLVMQEGTISTAVPPFSPNTPYIGWFETKLNNSGQHLTMSSVDDPAITSTVDRAIVRWNVGPGGNLLSESVVAKEGDVIGGFTGGGVADFATGPHNLAFNDSGSSMFVVDGDSATTTIDGGVFVNSTLIAQEGSASPVAARNWLTLTSSRLDMNNNGDYVYTGTLDNSNTATDLVIIKNNAKLIQEGDTLASIGGVFTFTAFGSGPVAIDDGGNVLWFGDWSDADTTKDTGLFLNDQLIVQEGVTQVNGMTVFSISSVQDGFSMSDNGQYIIFECVLAAAGGNIDAAVVMQVPEPACGLAALGVGAVVMGRRRARRP